jgi:hypothetical protein
VRALEGEEEHLYAGPQTVEQVVDALDVRAIDAALRLVHAATIEEEKAPRVKSGIQHALHARIDVDAAAGIAGADEMRVAIPDLGRIDALPRGSDELVVGEARRQRREAGIPDALVGPKAPQRDAGRGAAGEKT